MDQLLDIGGGVRLWWDRQGDGPAVALLHGGFDDSRTFDGNLAGLAPSFTVLRHDRRAQGRTPDVEGPFSQADMASDAAAWLERVADGPVHLVGYSDGAVVALLLALRRPDLVDRLVLVSGVFRSDGWLVVPEGDVTSFPDEVEEAYGEVSPDGRGHFAVSAAKQLANVREDLGVTVGRLASLAGPVLVLLADDDVVHLEHALDLYRALPRGQLAVVPGASHGLLQERPGLVTGLVRDFLTAEPAPVMPVRRAGRLDAPV